MAVALPPTQRARERWDDEGVKGGALGWTRMGGGVPWTWPVRAS